MSYPKNIRVPEQTAPSTTLHPICPHLPNQSNNHTSPCDINFSSKNIKNTKKQHNQYNRYSILISMHPRSNIKDDKKKIKE